MVVFLMRYWDIFLYWISLYNTTMKIIYLSATAYTIFLILKKKPYCLVIILKSHMIKLMIVLSIINIFTHVNKTIFYLNFLLILINKIIYSGWSINIINS
jgi:hypothetical protein